jgi:aspartate aminotransferase
MIDSVSKDTVCVVQELVIVSKKQELMAAAMKFARLSPPTFAQVASEAALDTPQSYFDEVISEYRERRDTLIAELHKIEGAKVLQGAFYCIAELPIENADDFARCF